jgi:Ca2+-binding EF-hand superfamily protein
VWCSFEKELIKKLSQKAVGAVSEETVCLKAFKYFDLNNNGTVEPDEFAKAIEKIGIMIPTQAVSNPPLIGSIRSHLFDFSSLLKSNI